MLEQVISDKAGWTRVAFGDVVRLSKQRAKDPEAEGYERVVGLEHIDPGDLRIRRWADIADGTTFTSVFRPGQVLFGKRRAYQRKVAVADFSGVCSGDIYVLEPSSDALMPELLPFICQTDAFFDHAVGTSAGSLSPRTNWKSLADFEFLLPPIQEQARLVEALSAIDDAIEKFDAVSKTIQATVVPLLRSFVGISDAVDEADLINGVRTKTLNNVPLVRVEELGTKERQAAQVGPFGGSVSRKHFSETGTPVLKINNLTELGTLDLTDQVFLKPEQAKSLAARYSVSEGDLVTAAQATIGRSALVTKEVEGAIISQHLIRVAVDTETCRPDWLLGWFLSPFVLRQIFGAVQGGTRAGLNTDDVANIRLPIPQIDQQDAHLEKLATCRARQAFTAKRDHELRQLRSMMLSEIEP